MRILLIDDEPTVLRAFARKLRNHAVETAESGKAALDLLASGVPPFDGIVCDVHMPKMDGVAFYRALAERDPAQASRIVFMAGHIMETDDEDFLESRVVLSKPFNVTELETLLASRAASEKGAGGSEGR
ncbi:MAG TPA: response regulator [Polyangiaceae bacterium]|jgi:two-component system sensor histidine kinase EvgS